MQRQFSEFGVSQRERHTTGLADNSKFDIRLARRLANSVQYEDINRHKQPKNKQGT